MKTENLIRALSEDCQPSISGLGNWILVVTISMVAAFVSMVTTVGIRPDLTAVADTWRFIFKAMATVSFAAITFLMTQHISRPQNIKVDLRLVLLPGVLVLIALVSEFTSMPRSTWVPRMLGTSALWCATLIPLLSIVPLIIILLKMRTCATTRPKLAGMLAGGLAGSIGATVYALHCVDDSPFFVAVWYSVGVITMTLIGGMAGRQWLRW